MVYLKRFFEWLKRPFKNYKERKELEAKIAELKKRDPFIYK